MDSATMTMLMYVMLQKWLNFFHLISFSCGPSSSGEMVSRRKILSRSRDDLHLDGGAHNPGEPDEEDIWFNKEKLYKVSQAIIYYYTIWRATSMAAITWHQQATWPASGRTEITFE